MQKFENPANIEVVVNMLRRFNEGENIFFNGCDEILVCSDTAVKLVLPPGFEITDKGGDLSWKRLSNKNNTTTGEYLEVRIRRI